MELFILKKGRCLVISSVCFWREEEEGSNKGGGDAGGPGDNAMRHVAGRATAGLSDTGCGGNLVVSKPAACRPETVQHLGRADRAQRIAAPLKAPHGSGGRCLVQVQVGAGWQVVCPAQFMRGQPMLSPPNTWRVTGQITATSGAPWQPTDHCYRVRTMPHETYHANVQHSAELDGGLKRLDWTWLE